MIQVMVVQVAIVKLVEDCRSNQNDCEGWAREYEYVMMISLRGALLNMEKWKHAHQDDSHTMDQ